tara:strand:- start:2520 stop:2783 length:264 start_codon:yes stop_codon:yes gene_type:complete
MRPPFPELPLLQPTAITNLSSPGLPRKSGYSSDDLSLSSGRELEARMYAAAMGRAFQDYRAQVKYSKWLSKQEERAINRFLKTKYSV